MINILEEARITRVAESAGAGQTDVESDAVDMKRFDAVTFVAMFGSFVDGGTATLKLQHSNESDDNFEDIEGAVASHTGDDGSGAEGVIAVELNRPIKRFVRAILEREDENIAVDGILAVRTDSSQQPVEQDDLLAHAFVLSGETAAAE